MVIATGRGSSHVVYCKTVYHILEMHLCHMYVHGRHTPFQYSYQQATCPARVHSANRRHWQRRNSNNFALNLEMDSELTGMESAFHSSNDIAVLNNLFPIHCDFTEDDYEMLLALDENSLQQISASIAFFPLSIHKRGDEVTCVVCLELPSAGDIYRHLPCLHKFHNECIDT